LTRREQVDFSYAIALAEGRMLVRASSGIRDLPDLDGKIVALAAGTTAEHYVRAAFDRLKINVRVLQVRDNAEGLLAVNSQRVDAFINDAVLLGGTLQKTENKAAGLLSGWGYFSSTEVSGQVREGRRVPLAAYREWRILQF
jgi:glutamate/aspartate transport system substrate-binding protein